MDEAGLRASRGLPMAAVAGLVALQIWAYPITWVHADPKAPFYSYLGCRTVALAVGLAATLLPMVLLGSGRTAIVAGLGVVVGSIVAGRGGDMLAATVAWGCLLLPLSRIRRVAGPTPWRPAAVATVVWLWIVVATYLDLRNSTWGSLQAGALKDIPLGVAIVAAVAWVDAVWSRSHARPAEAA